MIHNKIIPYGIEYKLKPVPSYYSTFNIFVAYFLSPTRKVAYINKEDRWGSRTLHLSKKSSFKMVQIQKNPKYSHFNSCTIIYICS